jgi:hypothetical protein
MKTKFEPSVAAQSPFFGKMHVSLLSPQAAGFYLFVYFFDEFFLNDLD